MSDLQIGDSPGKGKGVFAGRRFVAGEVLARDPVLPFEGELPPGLADYEFLWRTGVGCVVLGYGSIYNHSYEPNARYDRDFDRREMVFSTLREITPGEEITINYNGDPQSREPLWFELANG